MAMEGAIRSSSIAAALLFLTTLVVLATASAIASGDDAAASAAAAAEERWYHPPADEPYALVAFRNKDGEEIMLLDDHRSGGGASGFANRSGHWLYIIREAEAKRRRRRRPLALPESNDDDNRSRAEGLWTTLSVLSNTTADDSDDIDDEQAGYMLVGMETSGGDKIRLAVVAGQRSFFITSFARGWFRQPRWLFREGERHRLLTRFGGDGSHAEFVASNALAALMNEAKAYAASQSVSHSPQNNELTI